MIEINKLPPDLKLAVNETLKVMRMMCEENYLRVKDDIESCKDEEELINYLINPLQIYMTPYKEIKKDTIDKVIKTERIIMTEYFHVPHVMRDENGTGILTLRKHIAIPLPVRANQQKSFKEGKSAKDSMQRNVANQVTGDSKTGTFSDTEIVTTTVHGGTAILQELLGVTSHDLVANNELRGEIVKTGEAKLKGLTNESKNKGSLIYMDEIMKAMGYDTNLINTPEK